MYVCVLGWECTVWNRFNGRILCNSSCVIIDSSHDGEKDNDIICDLVSLSTKKNGGTVSHLFKRTWEKLNKHYLLKVLKR